MLTDEHGERLRAWFAARTGLMVLWADQPEGYTPDDYVRLTVMDIVRRGQDGVRYAYDPDRPPGQDMVPTIVGQREFTLQVEFRAWSQELGQTAEYQMQLLELALRLPSAEAMFLELNLGLMRTDTIRTSDVEVDRRAQSRATMDIRFATSIQLVDADEAQSSIATATVTTTLQDGAEGDFEQEQDVGEGHAPA